MQGSSHNDSVVTGNTINTTNTSTNTSLNTSSDNNNTMGGLGSDGDQNDDVIEHPDPQQSGQQQSQQQQQQSFIESYQNNNNNNQLNYFNNNDFNISQDINISNNSYTGFSGYDQSNNYGYGHGYGCDGTHLQLNSSSSAGLPVRRTTNQLLSSPYSRPQQQSSPILNQQQQQSQQSTPLLTSSFSQSYQYGSNLNVFQPLVMQPIQSFITNTNNNSNNNINININNLFDTSISPSNFEEGLTTFNQPQLFQQQVNQQLNQQLNQQQVSLQPLYSSGDQLSTTSSSPSNHSQLEVNLHNQTSLSQLQQSLVQLQQQQLQQQQQQQQINQAINFQYNNQNDPIINLNNSNINNININHNIINNNNFEQQTTNQIITDIVKFNGIGLPWDTHKSYLFLTFIVVNPTVNKLKLRLDRSEFKFISSTSKEIQGNNVMFKIRVQKDSLFNGRETKEFGLVAYLKGSPNNNVMVSTPIHFVTNNRYLQTTNVTRVYRVASMPQNTTHIQLKMIAATISWSGKSYCFTVVVVDRTTKTIAEVIVEKQVGALGELLTKSSNKQPDKSSMAYLVLNRNLINQNYDLYTCYLVNPSPSNDNNNNESNTTPSTSPIPSPPNTSTTSTLTNLRQNTRNTFTLDRFVVGNQAPAELISDYPCFNLGNAEIDQTLSLQDLESNLQFAQNQFTYRVVHNNIN